MVLQLRKFIYSCCTFCVELCTKASGGSHGRLDQPPLFLAPPPVSPPSSLPVLVSSERKQSSSRMRDSCIRRRPSVYTCRSVSYYRSSEPRARSTLTDRNLLWSVDWLHPAVCWPKQFTDGWLSHYCIELWQPTCCMQQPATNRYHVTWQPYAIKLGLMHEYRFLFLKNMR